MINEPQLNIVTTQEHDRTAIYEEISENENLYTTVIIVSIIVVIVALIL